MIDNQILNPISTIGFQPKPRKDSAPLCRLVAYAGSLKADI